MFAKRFLNFFRVRNEIGRDGEQFDLSRGKPERERPGEVLDQDPHETLEAAVDGSVEHDGPMLRAIRADKVQVELLGHLEIELDRTALPRPADAVFEMEVYLRSVESAVARVDGELRPGFLERFFERAFGDIPLLFGSHGILRPGGKLDAIREPEDVGINVATQLHDSLDFFLHNLRRAVQMRIVLREAANAHQSVEHARTLVPVDDAEFRHAQGKISIAPDLRLVDQYSAGTVHGFHGERTLVDFGEIHIVAIVIPVPGLDPEAPVEDEGRPYFRITVLQVHLSPEFHDRVHNDHAARMKERESRSFALEAEQIEFNAKFPVVAAPRFFKPLQMGFQILLRGERGSIHAGKHWILLAAPPVRPRNGKKFEKRRV